MDGSKDTNPRFGTLEKFFLKNLSIFRVEPIFAFV